MKTLRPLLLCLSLLLASAAGAAEPVVLESPALRVSFDAGDATVSLVDKRNGRAYHAVPPATRLAVESVEHDDHRFAADLVGPGGLRVRAEWAFVDEATLRCRITGDAAQPLAEGALTYPNALTLPVENSSLVLSDSGGFLFAADGSDLPEKRREEPVYKVYDHYHGMMAFFGVTDLEAGLSVLIETPADASYKLEAFEHAEAGAGFAPGLHWLPRLGTLGGERSVQVHVSEAGGYVPLAKHYREHVKAEGRYLSLRDKAAQRPAVERLVGAPHSWIMSSKYTRDSLELLDSIHDAGVEKLVFKTDTHANFPVYRERGARVEVNPAGHDAFLERADAHGYLVGKYMTYSSIRPYEADTPWHVLFWNFTMLREDNFLPEAGILRADGTRMPGWQKEGVRVCDRFGHETLLPAHLDFFGGYFRDQPALFVDVEGAIELLECHDPEHPMTRAECLDWRIRRAELFLEANPDWVLGTETGDDYLLHRYDWIEGPPSNQTYPDWASTQKDPASPHWVGGWDRKKSGDREPSILYRTRTADPVTRDVVLNPAMRIPLYELVHGDQVVSTCRWEYPHNKSPELWDRKDLFAMLWGTAPTYNLTAAVWEAQRERVVASIERVCPWLEEVGYDELIDHAFLTEDRLVQRSTFGNGRTITVNFDEKPREAGGVEIEAMGHRIGG